MDEMSALSWVGCGFLLSPGDSGRPYKTCSTSPRYLGGQHSLYAFPHRSLQPHRTQNGGEDRDMRLAVGGRVGGTTFPGAGFSQSPGPCVRREAPGPPQGPKPTATAGPGGAPWRRAPQPGHPGGGAARPGDMGAVPKPGAGKRGARGEG